MQAVDDVVVSVDPVVHHLGSAACVDEKRGRLSRLHSRWHLDVHVGAIIEGAKRLPRNARSATVYAKLSCAGSTLATFTTLP